MVVNNLTGSGSYVFNEIHFDCNCIEHIDTPPQSFYALGLFSLIGDANSTNIPLTNSSARDNTMKGGGGTNHIFNGGTGYDNDYSSTGMDISGNIVTTPVLISDFRGSGVTYVP